MREARLENQANVGAALCRDGLRSSPRV
ncbi:hypothetical protein IAE39_000342, partial [Pseudomonas sp. S37]|nr:hypothetical protein [Pseudomonas sp. S37]